MSKRIELKGKTFTYLTVIDDAPSESGRASFVCQCKCGKLIVVKGKLLRNKNTTSCGCRKKEGLHTTHGLSKGKKRIYNIWQGMKQRCQYKKAINYHLYGSRGIKVCERWQIFSNFYDDMNESYEKHLKEYGKIDTSLDRINNNGDYCLKNCKWSTKREQYLNSRSNKIKWDSETRIEK